MAQNKAFVDTTILAEVLLKTGPSHDAAKQALQRYQQTLLPVYAIKEWKRGQLAKYVYIHNKLKSTGSYSATNNALAKLYMRHRWQSTAFEAIAAATTLNLPSGPITTTPAAAFDGDLADRYRLAFKTLIYDSWESRRSVTTDTVMDLECYLEVGPRELPNGEIDIRPRDCNTDGECCLAKRLRQQKENLLKVRDAIPSGGRPEDAARRDALKHLAVHPNSRFERKDCQALGDAFFALFAPTDSEILTTNLKDHLPLANALGKSAVTP